MIFHVISLIQNLVWFTTIFFYLKGDFKGHQSEGPYSTQVVQARAQATSDSSPGLEREQNAGNCTRYRKS